LQGVRIGRQPSVTVSEISDISGFLLQIRLTSDLSDTPAIVMENKGKV
jgi:hypothetical protein